LKLRVRRLERHAWLEPPGSEEEVPLHDAVRIDLKRQEDIRRSSRPLYGFRIESSEHADNFVRLSVQRDGAADGALITAESTFPEALAQHRDPAASRDVFGGSKGATGDHRRAEQAEKVGTDMRGRDLLRVTLGEVDDADPIGGDVLERRRLTTPEIELGWRGAWSRPLWRGVQERHDPARFRVGQRPQKDAVDHREDCRVRADAERQRQDGGECERGALPDRPPRVPQVVKERLQGPSHRCRGVDAS
jgi:hypothetical protein